MGILSLLLLIPLAGAALLHFIKDARTAKLFALMVMVVAFVVSLVVYLQFDPAAAGYQFTEKYSWVSSGKLDINYIVGIDGMSLLLILLTTFLSVIALIGTWNSVDTKVAGLMALLLLLETGMIGVFASIDLFLFYIFWELILIPMYFIIGMWGGKRRIYAAVKFFLYTLGGSLFMLVAIIWLGLEAQKLTGIFTTDLSKLLAMSANMPIDVRTYLFWAFDCRSRSRCHSSRCIRGCRTRTSKRRRSAPSCLPASC